MHGKTFTKTQIEAIKTTLIVTHSKKVNLNGPKTSTTVQSRNKLTTCHNCDSIKNILCFP